MAANSNSVSVNLADAIDQALELKDETIEINGGRLWRFAKDAMGLFGKKIFLFNDGDVSFMNQVNAGVIAINWRHGAIKKSTSGIDNPNYWDFGTIKEGKWPDHPKPRFAVIRGDGPEGKLRSYCLGLDLVIEELREAGRDQTEKHVLEYDWDKTRERIVKLASAIKELLKEAA